MPKPFAGLRAEQIGSILILLFYFLLFPDKNAREMRNISQSNKVTDPVTNGQVNAARDSFELYYDRANQGLSTADIGVKTDSLILDLFQKYPNAKDSGYVFHYALSSDETSIFYIMSNGVYDSDEDTAYFYPFPKDEFNDGFDYYLLLHGESNTGNYRAIDETEFCNFTQRYEKNFNKMHDSVITPVSSISNHPYSVYHEGDELNEFFEEYEPDTSNVLLLRHCAGPVGADNHNYHIPVFIFMLEGNGNTDYEGKALDVGNTCPPHCAAGSENFCE